MLRRWTALSLLVLTSGLTSCAGAKLGKGLKKVVVEDFAEGRVVDVSITEKLTGSRDLLFMSVPRKNEFLEGYIQGVVTDYQDNPVQGVVVRAVASGEGEVAAQGGVGTALSGSSFDPGVSDTNGFYRLRFSLPIVDNRVDVRGRILLSPGWEQERDNLGKAYEPQLKQTQFRLFFEKKRGRIIFSEGIRKGIVAPANSASGGGKVPALPGGKAPEREKAVGSAGAVGEKAPESKQGEDDLFKGFGIGP